MHSMLAGELSGMDLPRTMDPVCFALSLGLPWRAVGIAATPQRKSSLPRLYAIPKRRAVIRAALDGTTTASGEMPAALAKMVRAFAAVSDPKLRYQQLLFFARELPDMDGALKTPENLVSGCQSVVHIEVALDADGLVLVQADSDAQLTKGLVALLVRGFTSARPADVLATDDNFLAASGLAVALTPARNNGFANALALVKSKVRALMETPAASADDDEEEAAPTYAAIMRKLATLSPTSLDVYNESAMHAGHAGVPDGNSETHFKIDVVSDDFDGISLVKRHRMIYRLLATEMQPGKIHALSINARTPSEVARG